MEKIEPCDICGVKYTKEMCKIANKYLFDDDPCYCRAIKKIEVLIKENRKLKEKVRKCQNEVQER